MKLVWAMALLLASSGLAHSQSKKEIYELQERCGRSATQMFDRDFPKEERKGVETFENNYSVRLNKCFLLEDNTMTSHDQGKTHHFKLLTLIDVNGNKIYGSFSPLHCEVQDRKCSSEQEFRGLIRAYMEE